MAAPVPAHAGSAAPRSAGTPQRGAAQAASGSAVGAGNLGRHADGGGSSGDDGDAGHGGAYIAGACVAAIIALVLFIAAPAVVLFQDDCAGAGVSEGLADPVDLTTLEVAARVQGVAQDMRLSDRYVVSAFATVLVETGGGVEMRNLGCHNAGECDRDSVGAFQQRNFSPWTDHGRNRRNVRDAARTFFEQAKINDRPGYTVGQLAQAVQASAYPDRYDAAVPRAREVLTELRTRSGRSNRASSRAARIQLSAIAAQVVLRKRNNNTGPRARAASSPSAFGLAWPTEIKTISSPFGPRLSPCPGCSSFHEGADIGAPHGAPVHAAAAGQVVFQGVLGGYGNYICLRHQANFATCYAHLSRFGRQGHGALVRQGQVIGYVGSTGIGTGAHLHFEVRTSGGTADPAVDPIPYLEGAASPASAETGCDGGAVPEGEAPTTSGPTAELNGTVVSAPASAPDAVRRAIAAGNAIQHLTYTYGGGHNPAYRPTPGLDCSSTVSYVLWKAGLLNGPPLTSGDFATWGEPGPGRWVTIYSHPGHTYIVVAGQRLDTSPAGSSVNSERGPRWRGSTPRSATGFTATHPPGL